MKKSILAVLLTLALVSPVFAAEQGSISAQFGLGYCYLKGNGVSRNISKAKEWLRKAADQGDEDAIELLREL